MHFPALRHIRSKVQDKPAAGSGVHLYFVPGQLAAMHRFDAAAGQGTLYLGECSAR